MAQLANKDQYIKCAHINRSKPKYEVDQELYKQIAADYRTLPTFEKSLFEKVHIAHYSLQTNDYLKCRWGEYKRNIESRVFAPFQFPDIRDLHFYNCAVRILPDQTLFRSEHRMKMMIGPGVDSRGHLPIPQESMMKRGTAERGKRGKQKSKTDEPKTK